MGARSEQLEHEIPSAREVLAGSFGFEERRERSAELVERYRRDRMVRHIQRAVDEGWIGEQAAAWLREAPVHEAMLAIGEIEKWRYLLRARAEGWWEAAAIDAEEQERLAGLPAGEFFRELRASGMPGPPRDGRRGGRRGEGGGPGGPGGPGGGPGPGGGDGPRGERGDRHGR